MKTFLQHLNEKNGLVGSILSTALASSPVVAAQNQHTVSKGDTISAIAQKNKLSTDQLLSFNPEIKDPNKISIGQTVNLSAEQPKSQQTSVQTQQSTKPQTKQTGIPAWKPLISEFEGFRTDAYWDDKGKVWTIGKGSTTHPDGRPIRQGDKITKEQSDEYMQHYVDTKVMPRLQKIPTWSKLNPNQQSALISFGYNVGPGFYGSNRGCLKYQKH
jgi:GH24 family phage-related lysozyme (muramidase)